MICPSCQKEIADNSRFCYLCGVRLMEQPQPQAQPAPEFGPRRLYRSATDRKLGGVCGGIGEYFEVDPTILRVLFFLGMVTGFGIVAYLVAWIVIPLGPEGAPGSGPGKAGRRLYRSARDKKVGGVCAGVAYYLGIDPTIVRVVWLCFVLLGGVGLFTYLLLWFILPLEDVQTAGYPAAAGNP
jgi:phage shock protein PspC (stress-responsive transcriptional regulator)